VPSGDFAVSALGQTYCAQIIADVTARRTSVHPCFTAVSGVLVIYAGVPVIARCGPKPYRSRIGRLHVPSAIPESSFALLSKEFCMTMLNTVPPHTMVASAIQRRVRFLLKRLGRLLNHWLSAAIAEQKRRADIAVLHHFSDRELKDIGLTRGDLGEGLAEAARIRTGLQRSRQP
jgi:uncharacterized protein YjiS (DUF1127 family)